MRQTAFTQAADPANGPFLTSTQLTSYPEALDAPQEGGQASDTSLLLWLLVQDEDTD